MIGSVPSKLGRVNQFRWGIGSKGLSPLLPPTTLHPIENRFFSKETRTFVPGVNQFRWGIASKGLSPRLPRILLLLLPPIDNALFSLICSPKGYLGVYMCNRKSTSVYIGNCLKGTESPSSCYFSFLQYTTLSFLSPPRTSKCLATYICRRRSKSVWMGNFLKGPEPPSYCYSSFHR